eukprot:12108059-Ditylum_brightwellii.AAC.1
MERGQPVWLRSQASRWGWVPAVIHDREEIVIKGITVIKITLRDDPNGGGDASEPALTGGSTTSSPYFDADLHRSNSISG